MIKVLLTNKHIWELSKREIVKIIIAIGMFPALFILIYIANGLILLGAIQTEGWRTIEQNLLNQNIYFGIPIIIGTFAIMLFFPLILTNEILKFFIEIEEELK